MVEKSVRVVNPLGLHARAAARFVREASRFHSAVTVSKQGTTIDGKSILGILFLAATAGTHIVIAASGEDEREAVEALSELVTQGLGEIDRES